MTEVQLRPMLAAKFDEAKVAKHLAEDGLLLVQPKIDGMRVLIENGVPRSRSWKEWTNRSIRAWAADLGVYKHGWDGEMIPGLKNDPNVFRDAMSLMRAEDGGTEFTYYLFDNYLLPGIAYQDRQKHLRAKVQEEVMQGSNYTVKVVHCPTEEVLTMEELYAKEAEYLEAGWEGLIIRRRLSGYKYNRATPSDGWLTKMKRFEDAEARIIGVEPRYHNANEATTSALGYTARSAHKENLVAEECLGAFQVELIGKPDVKFNIGVLKGVTLGDKEKMWQRREELIGHIITFKHQGYGGGYDAPRTPVFYSFRDPIEL